MSASHPEVFSVESKGRRVEGSKEEETYLPVRVISGVEGTTWKRNRNRKGRGGKVSKAQRVAASIVFSLVSGRRAAKKWRRDVSRLTVLVELVAEPKGRGSEGQARAMRGRGRRREDEHELPRLSIVRNDAVRLLGCIFVDEVEHLRLEGKE